MTTAWVRRTLAAGFASGTAIAALAPVLQGSGWLLRVLGAVAAVVVAGLLARASNVPPVLQPLAGLLLLAAYLVVVFVPGTLHLGLPTHHTLDALRTLARVGQSDVRTYSPPVPADKGLVLLVAAGVGGIALVVDVIAVLLDHVAMAGIPLLALFAVPSAVQPGGLGSLPFALGATGWLALLLEEGSERVSRWGAPLRAATTDVRGGEDNGLGRLGRRIGATALGLAVVVPMLVPGLDHRLLGGSVGGPGNARGGPTSATTYNPITRLQDELTLPTPRQLFVYTTDDPHPDYVRMTTLDTYNGSGWSSSKLEADRQQARVQKGLPQPNGESTALPHQPFTMRIAVDDTHLDVHWLPLPYGPRQVDVNGAWLWDPLSQTAFSASRTTRQLPPYTVTADRVLPSRDDLLGAAGSDPAISARYGRGLAVSPAVMSVVRRLVDGRPTAYDRAVAIQRYFTTPANGFVYDLSPSLPTAGQDALDAFLQGKHGFCEQFATAMAVLLRVAGIPSRVAVGFTPGQAVAGTTHTFSVTTSDAHAWPEAWFAGTGWVRFEPTPGALGATTPDYSLAPLVAPRPGASPRPTPTPSSRTAPGAFHDADQLLRGPVRTGSSGLGGAAGTALLWGLVALAVLTALVGPGLGTAARRRRRARRTDPHLAWQQLQDDVRDVGGPWLAADSPRTAGARLAGLLDETGREALARLVAAVELARYAPTGRASGVDLVADGTAVRRALLASAPRRVRWRAVTMPPSTLNWAGHTVSERVADLLDLSDRALAWVFRPFRRLLRA